MTGIKNLKIKTVCDVDEIEVNIRKFKVSKLGSEVENLI